MSAESSKPVAPEIAKPGEAPKLRFRWWVTPRIVSVALVVLVGGGVPLIFHRSFFTSGQSVVWAILYCAGALRFLSSASMELRVHADDLGISQRGLLSTLRFNWEDIDGWLYTGTFLYLRRGKQKMQLHVRLYTEPEVFVEYIAAQLRHHNPRRWAQSIVPPEAP